MKKYLLIAGGLLLSAALVQAQSSGGFKVGAHYAYQFGGELNFDDGPDIDLDPGGGFGAQLIYQANDALSFELSATRFTTALDEDTFWVPSDEEDIVVSTYAATIRIGRTISEGLYLFFGGGGSYYSIDPDYEGVDIDDEFGFHVCAGIELPLTDLMSFFAEYRYSLVTFDDDEDGEFDYQFDLLRVGVNITL